LSSAARIVSLAWRWAIRSSALIDNAVYQFGDFTAAADNPGGIDTGNPAGVSIYDFTVGPGGKVVDGTTMYDLNDLNVFLANGNHIEIDTVPGQFTNFLEPRPMVRATGSKPGARQRQSWFSMG
jgi:hypothetical protein